MRTLLLQRLSSNRRRFTNRSEKRFVLQRLWNKVEIKGIANSFKYFSYIFYFNWLINLLLLFYFIFNKGENTCVRYWWAKAWKECRCFINKDIFHKDDGITLSNWETACWRFERRNVKKEVHRLFVLDGNAQTYRKNAQRTRNWDSTIRRHTYAQTKAWIDRRIQQKRRVLCFLDDFAHRRTRTESHHRIARRFVWPVVESYATNDTFCSLSSSFLIYLFNDWLILISCLSFAIFYNICFLINGF